MNVPSCELFVSFLSLKSVVRLDTLITCSVVCTYCTWLERLKKKQEERDGDKRRKIVARDIADIILR